ncbi:Protein CBG20883 [Caenorhabditis briggsae]|uniref:Uncharacterized protein n=2 Tax=Caenorhabditis briggsae TaxID=6238 RepID=A0AAE9EDY3_CAEBR|nr:Protein CBG20883 [Caenorhabditis briggsae]ULU07645.1 hypothetical protein L3Y34_018979 [Caenorhabditis briggsae]UMM19565.1 hypothetical protein L5515_015106 [Caenorhabditis briggsae]CAP37822.1 Protein CBG20883 [Caenorhabditis briggsae]
MSRLSSLLILVCIGALLVETFAAPDEPIIVRSKRQQCRCVKNPNGGLTCSCAKGPANGSSSSSSVGNGVQYDVPQSTEIAQQLTQMTQQSPGMGAARCGCIQIVIQGAPQYNCQCGDQNGNPLPTSTTMAPTTTSTSTTTTTTTTTPAPTTTSTTTTQAPVSYPQVPTQTQGNNGACNCIMISITSPQTAQYQCQCAQPQQQQQFIVDYEDPTEEYGSQTAIPGTLPAPATTTPLPQTTQPTTTTTPSTTTPSYPQLNPSMYTQSPPTVYPAIGQLATGQETCYCLDPTTSIMSGCGCRCNCATLMVTVPNAYCGCPQPGQVQYADTYDYTQAYTQPPTTTTTAPTTTTQAPTTQPPTTTSPIQYADQTATQYPLTTTCVMYVNVPTTACSCLPQYDQCAQNVCCLKAKYRSYKKAEETQPSTLDVLMNVLQTIKTKLE